MIKYTYKNGNGTLKELTYANGDKMTATYNGLGQMIAETWYDKNGNVTHKYKYGYNNQGELARTVDIFYSKDYNYGSQSKEIIC